MGRGDTALDPDSIFHSLSRTFNQPILGFRVGLGPRDTETVSLCSHHVPFNKENTLISQLLGVSKCRSKQNWLEVKNMT